MRRYIFCWRGLCWSEKKRHKFCAKRARVVFNRFIMSSFYPAGTVGFSKSESSQDAPSILYAHAADRGGMRDFFTSPPPPPPPSTTAPTSPSTPSPTPKPSSRDSSPSTPPQASPQPPTSKAVRKPSTPSATSSSASSPPSTVSRTQDLSHLR